jgi:hypothetical protein
MKKIISLLSIFTIVMCARSLAQVTFSPPVFTAEDEVTLTVDVTGTPMAGQTEVYIWAFSNPGGGGPAKDGSSNGSWTNSNASGKMTAAGTNKWSYKFTGTVLFGLSPAELSNFGFLVKAKDGSKQTPDYKPYNFDPLVFTPAKLRVFPSKVDKDDVVTVNFDRSLGTTVEEQRMEPVSATITMFDDAGNQVGSPLTVNARKLDNTIWGASFIGTASFTPPAGRQLKKFKYKFNGTVKDVTGALTTVSSSEVEMEYINLK